MKSIEREDEPDAAIAKLTDQVKELKIQRFQCAIEIKVRQLCFKFFKCSSGSCGTVNLALSNSTCWFFSLLLCLDRIYLLRLLLIGEVLLKLTCVPLNLKLRFALHLLFLIIENVRLILP